MKSYSFLFWAYNLVWLGIAAYVWLVLARVRRVDRQLTAIERELERRGEQGEL